MSKETLQITPELYHYLLDVSLREHPLLKELRDATAAMPEANMQISPDQGQFMAMLVKLINATRIIEVGVFTGYSSLAMALAFPDDDPYEGKILACDVSEEYTALAKQFWQRAGVDEKIDLHLAPATETLSAAILAGESGQYDFAFIDADKANYQHYYEQCLQLIRPGGLIAVDNVLWNGAVIDQEKQDEDTRAIRKFNQSLKEDKRVDISLVTVADGLTLIRKK